jgi:ABC-type nitrate/sulfonate/bicarbonate transport system substrate-binding protein
LAAVSIAAGLAAAVSGCASSSGGGSGGGSSKSGSTTSVTLGNPAATYGEAAYVAADKQGYLNKNGISSKSVLLSSSSTLLAALVSGGVDFGTTNGAAVLAARAKGVPVVAVCGLSQGVPGLAMVVKPSLMKSLHLVSGDVSGDLKKLKGQVIGVNSPTATGGKILAGLEQDAGLPKGYITETTVASSTMVAALQHGEIAGFFQDIPVPQQAVSNGSGVVAFDTSQVASLRDIQYNVIATSENYLKSHPAAIKSFLTGIKQGEADLQARNAAALQDIGNIYPGVSPKVVQDAATTGLETNCSMPQSAWSALTTVSAKWGLVPKSTTAAQVAASYKTGL